MCTLRKALSLLRAFLTSKHAIKNLFNVDFVLKNSIQANLEMENQLVENSTLTATHENIILVLCYLK